MNRLLRWLKRPVALNYATVVFCFLEGATLSILLGTFLQPLELLEPPMIVSAISVGTAGISTFLLPLWCLFQMEKRDKGLALFGAFTAVLAIAFLMMMPTLG